MSKFKQAALLTAVVSILFIALELVLHVRTAMAGVFVMGASGGFLMGEEIEKETRKKSSAHIL
jgi:hypothetical protein